MAMGPERSKPLHNFTLPYGLKWGNQRHLRCAKVESNDEISAIHRESIGRRGSKLRSPENQDSGEEIGAVREKLMFDLLTEADKMKNTIFKEAKNETTLTGAVDLSRPWNLRTRRAACKEPNGYVIVAGESAGDSSVAGKVAGDSSAGEKRERVKFSVPLSRKEMEEDFMAMVGHRPPRRPKKRAKLVQKNLDTLFPGLWLTEITPDLYKVPDDQ
ncbi:uncharacterized protein LOC132059915 [Lycium ferocissimum]|uniref:uncharacterized protein LOC132059915 n=1 Tax=Lycium ferocissimum TaxID=112874 RepID=UPI0028169B5A|nr:uncharacterized protein LOC132059915 [Lycium ferocissimum]